MGVVHRKKYIYSLSASRLPFGKYKIRCYDTTVGRVYQWGNYRMQARTGISYIDGNPDDKFTHKPYQTIGVPMKLGLHMLASKHVSLGIDVQGNINSKNPYILPTMSMKVGLLDWGARQVVRSDHKWLGWYISPKLGLFYYSNEIGLLMGDRSISLSHTYDNEIFGPLYYDIVDVTYGMVVNRGLFRLHMQGGAGAMKGKIKEELPEMLVGTLALKLGCKIRPFKSNHFSFGIDLSTYINNTATIIMPFISIEYGLLSE